MRSRSLVVKWDLEGWQPMQGRASTPVLRQIRELANEGFGYVLESGAEGSIHLDPVLEYNEDPTYLRDLVIYQLTVEAKRRVEGGGLSRRELARRLKTSVPQLYRLLDTTNNRKSINQLICLLQVLDCGVELVVTDRKAVV